MKRKILTNFTRYAVLVLIEIVRFVILKMTDNAYFPIPDPTLDYILDLVNDLETKNTTAKSGAKQAREEMVAARLLMNDAMFSLALYIEKIAKGNELILVSSGFPLAKIRRAAIRESFWAKRGLNSGDVLIGCVSYPKAKAYVWELFAGTTPPEDDNLWKFVKATVQRKTKISNLIKGSTVWFRYCAVTKEGMMAWSNAIEIVI